MSLIVIDDEKCGRDGLCARICPMGLIIKQEDGRITEVEGAESVCMSCGHCIAICPSGALSLAGKAATELQQIRKDLRVDGHALEQLMKSRRSIRAYSDEPVPRETLQRLLDTARWAPTARNLQPVHYLVLENPEEVRKLANAVAEALAGREAQAPLLEAFRSGKDVIFRGAPHLIIAHAHSEGIVASVDCTIALTYLELFAASLGLGTCWAGYLMVAASQNPDIEKFLKIPAGHRLYGALMVGNPRYRFQRVPPRRELRVEWR